VRLIALSLCLMAVGCASVPTGLDNNGLPLGKSGWQLSGGADFDRKMWFILFYKPWGKQELDGVITEDQIVLPE
jgi:hypothetical protein